MGNNQQAILLKAVYKVCRPLARLLLRNGVTFKVFSDIAKRAYVDAATQEFKLENRKQSDSRVATLTGLTRKEVHRLHDITLADDPPVEKYHRAARVVYGWVHDRTYCDANGECLELAIEGEEPSFSTLVRAYSGDMTPRSIMDELVRVGVAEVLPAHKLRLRTRAYIPHTDELGKLGILGQDVGGLIATIDRNIYEKDRERFFQRKVYYDNLPEESLPIIRALITESAQRILEEFDRAMSQHDRDVNPSAKGTGRKAAGVGIYYFEDDNLTES
ncbi:MAG: DUF6502 family protein [Gammaproteobacteria bacterium]|nr:DUF6502 family protein [Gammaproteobacteria bacterium]